MTDTASRVQAQTRTAGQRPPPSGEAEVRLDIDFSGDDLTLNERVDVEKVCGDSTPFEVLRDRGRSSFYRAVAWVILRRTDKRITLEEAGELQVRFDRG